MIGYFNKLLIINYVMLELNRVIIEIKLMEDIYLKKLKSFTEAIQA